MAAMCFSIQFWNWRIPEVWGVLIHCGKFPTKISGEGEIFGSSINQARPHLSKLGL